MNQVCLQINNLSGRGREIRTPDILLPKQARYQAALYPVSLVAVPVQILLFTFTFFVLDTWNS